MSCEYIQVPMEARGVEFPLELEGWWLPVAQSGYGELNLGPVLEQGTLLLLSHLFRHCCLTILTHFLRVFMSRPWYVKLITNYVVSIQIWGIIVIVAPLAWRSGSLERWWQRSFETTFSTAELMGVSLLSVLEFCLTHYSIFLKAYNMSSFLYILLIFIFKGDYDRTFARRWYKQYDSGNHWTQMQWSI